ncbi:MAG: hypothetical protein H6502_01035 [Candidatus Woesearchaeota archaeon]|nr:MAG: hypothetical protein H6502_01035 [Candidatus Woesearchaeota archaeon]
MANELFPPPEKGKKQEGTDYSEKITHLNTRIKLLEERNGTLHKKNQITDDRFREVSKDAVREIRDLSEDLLAIKSTLHEMQAELALLRSEMKFLARQPELKEIETYINLWQPQNFVTRQELEEVKK